MSGLRLALCSFSSGTADGIARMDATLAAGLADLGVDALRVIVDSGSAGEVRRQGDVVRVPLAQAYEMLCEAFARVDVVQFNGSFDPVICAAAAAAGVPAVIEVMHNAEPGGMHSNIDVTVCVSDYVRGLQHGARALTIHNGVDLEKFVFQPRARDGSVRVLQVANARKALAVDLADQATLLRRLRPGCRILLAGGRPAPVAPGVENYGVTSDMAPVYQAADLVFLLGLRDSFGLALIEGMACGCVPVGWAASGASEIITPEKNGWLVQEASEAPAVLLRAMDSVAAPSFTRMRREARRTVEQRFSAARCSGRYFALYRALGAVRPGWKRRPCRSGRPAWMPLAQCVVFLGVDQKEQALAAAQAFVQAGQCVEGSFLAHPNGQAAVYVALRYCLLLDQEGERDLARALFALLRTSGCRGKLLEETERRLAGGDDTCA